MEVKDLSIFMKDLQIMKIHYKKLIKQDTKKILTNELRISPCLLCCTAASIYDGGKKSGLGNLEYCHVCPWIVIDNKFCDSVLAGREIVQQSHDRIERWMTTIQKEIGDE